jgi:CDP-glucose 4,6-dehydratase
VESWNRQVENLEMNTETFWNDRRVFVTGATGMVGYWLVKDLLAAGARVVALVRDPDPQSGFYRSGDYRRVSLVQGQLEDYSTLERAINDHEIETVFHLAAQPIVSVAHRCPLPTFEANIRGTYNLLEACRVLSGLVKRVVIASSDKAYGEHEHLPYTEEMPLQGKFPYEVSKSCADLIAQTYFQTYGTPLAILRCGNIYGGGDLNWSRIVPYTIRCFLNNERPIIRSDGSFIRDYIYVKDVSRCYMKAAECLSDKKTHGEAYNFSLERPLTVLQLVEILQQLMNCKHLAPDIRNNAAGEIRDQYLSTSKAHTKLGWQPKHSLEQGLIETIDWYSDYLKSSGGSTVGNG